MRVAMYYSNSDVRLQEQPAPKVGPGELLVRVEASGICGSDVMEWYRIKKAPRVLGHEIAGQVTEVGEGVRKHKVGDRVVVSHHVPCNTCFYCLSGHATACDTLRTTNFDPGGFAEFLRVPVIHVDRGVFVLPDEVSYEEGAFAEPLACVVRGQRLARSQPGQSVLVIGSGITGLLHIQLACAYGAGRVVATDIAEFRLDAARRFGAEAVIHAQEDVPAFLREVNNGRLADLVIVCAGAPAAITQAFKSVERGGTILLFAPTTPGVTVPFAVNDFWANEVTLTHAYGGSPPDLTVALELIRARRLRLKEMITHRLPLSETQRGFQLVAQAKESIKVIIEPQK